MAGRKVRLPAPFPYAQRWELTVGSGEYRTTQVLRQVQRPIPGQRVICDFPPTNQCSILTRLVSSEMG